MKTKLSIINWCIIGCCIAEMIAAFVSMRFCSSTHLVAVQENDTIYPFRFIFSDCLNRDGYRSGYINDHLEPVIPFKYINCSVFDNGFAIVAEKRLIDSFDTMKKKNKKKSFGFIYAEIKYGVIDKNGDVVVPNSFDELVIINDYDLLIAKNGNKCSVIDFNGNEVIPTGFEEISYLTKDLVKVKKDSKWGVVDLDGNGVIPTEFEMLLSLYNDLVTVKKDGKWGAFDLNGKEVIPTEFEMLLSLYNDLVKAKKDGKWGAFDLNGKEVIPTGFEEISYLTKDLVKVKKDSKWGALDLNGNEIVPTDFEAIWSLNNDLVKAKKDKKWCVYNKDGKVLLTEYDEIISLGKGYLGVGKIKNSTNCLFAIADSTGKLITDDYRYLSVGLFSNNGLSIVEKSRSHYTIINTKGESILNIDYQKIVSGGDLFYVENNQDDEGHSKCSVRGDGFFVENDNGLWGILDTNGKEVIKPRFSNCPNYYYKNQIIVKENNQYCIYNYQGECISKNKKFDDVRPFKNGYAAVKTGDKWGFIDQEGKEVFGKYEMVADFSNGFAGVKKDSLWGFINTKGEEIVMSRYDVLSMFDPKGMAKARIGFYSFNIDTIGNFKVN